MTAYQSNLVYNVQNIQPLEPQIFAAGDELVFKKDIPVFIPANGWSLLYVLTDENGVEIATVTSIPGNGDLNNCHIIDVVNFQPNLAQGIYIFTGYAINGQERRQIYFNWLKIVPNYPAGTAQAPQTTHSQRMITLLESKLEELEAQPFDRTDVQHNSFLIEQRNDVLTRLKYYRELRNKELQVARSRNGQPLGNVSDPIFVAG